VTTTRKREQYEEAERLREALLVIIRIIPPAYCGNGFSSSALSEKSYLLNVFHAVFTTGCQKITALMFF
jgi:hypothetical protein